jgi:hypothetical protein
VNEDKCCCRSSRRNRCGARARGEGGCTVSLSSLCAASLSFSSLSFSSLSFSSFSFSRNCAGLIYRMKKRFSRREGRVYVGGGGERGEGTFSSAVTRSSSSFDLTYSFPTGHGETTKCRFQFCPYERTEGTRESHTLDLAHLQTMSVCANIPLRRPLLLFQPSTLKSMVRAVPQSTHKSKLFNTHHPKNCCGQENPLFRTGKVEALTPSPPNPILVPVCPFVLLYGPPPLCT